MANQTTVCNLTKEEQSREALGRWLALVGTGISVLGTAALMSVNPTVKTTAGAIFDRLPAPMQKHKTAVVVGLIAIGGGVAWYILNKRAKAKAGVA